MAAMSGSRNELFGAEARIRYYAAQKRHHQICQAHIHARRRHHRKLIADLQRDSRRCDERCSCRSRPKPDRPDAATIPPTIEIRIRRSRGLSLFSSGEIIGRIGGVLHFDDLDREPGIGPAMIEVLLPRSCHTWSLNTSPATTGMTEEMTFKACQNWLSCRRRPIRSWKTNIRDHLC